MRSLLLLTIAACSSVTSLPGDDDGSGSGSGSGSSTKAAVCGEARDCTSDDNGCASYPYESLPDRCNSICYEGRCCSQYEGVWHLVIYDCAWPFYDGGIGDAAGSTDAL
jgi:hypothetical protein